MAETGRFALISPDIATCGECLADFTDPGNRRYGYAFTNCTNCGPRYTIIRDIPYDRPNTTMAAFEMCAECRAEYEDPANRRFHAQPNACPVCGPALSAEMGEAQRRLADDEIVAIKGLGGFHLACDARKASAVGRLRARKRRSDKPFAVMVRDLEAARELCVVDDAATRALSGPRHAIVILPRRADAQLPEGIAPGNPTLGVMLPYTPLHHLLFRGAAFTALVMTSGNLSEEPIVVDNRDARERLSGVADWFLEHNRDIYMRADDSVVRMFEGEERVMRRSRGYAPQTLDVGRDLPELLACGGELKNAFCLTKGTHAILSQHIGDLENYETLVFFEETLANLKKLFRVTPRAVAYDLHPGYLSTKYALELEGLEKIGVQHHHAHIASCMAENGLTGEVIGVAIGWHGIRPGRRDLGRRVPGGRLHGVHAAGALALRAAGRGRRGDARTLAVSAGVCGCGGAVGERGREAAACGAANDCDANEYGDDVVMRAAVRCGGGADWSTLRGQFRRTGGDRVGGDCGRLVRAVRVPKSAGRTWISGR